MAKLLLFEHSAPLREFLRLHLETAGHQVLVAEDVSAAERIALASEPQLVISGSGRQGVEGLKLLSRLRGSATAYAGLPFIMVSARADADAIGQARAAGAADYLILPVTRESLLISVAAHLSNVAGTPGASDPAAALTATDLRGVRRSLTSTGFLTPVDPAGAADTMPPVEGALPGAPLRPASPATASASQETRSGTVLFADIRSFSSLAEMLTTQEVADLLNSYFVRACEPIVQQGGWIVKLLGDGVLALFEDVPRAPSHAERALKAALFLCIVAQRFDGWLRRRFDGKDLPDFAVGAGVHTGEVMVCRINTGAGVDTTIIGDTVNVASRLEEQTKRLGASVVTSLDTLALAGPRFIPGKRGSLLVRGRASPVEITEITGLRPRPSVDGRGLETYNVIHDAVAYNTQIILRERDRVLSEPHRIRRDGHFAPLRPLDSPIKIPGFRLIRRLGQGGMSRAFLAEYEMTGSLRVLKVLNVADGGFDLLRRFLQEHELISRLRHPHVATIFDHGQTESHAYIVMEWFAGGDLRSQMEQPLPPPQALDYLAQICEALVALHAAGIVHRDLKPENLLLREDGTLVLADFGIAKDLTRPLGQTRHGEALGTPYYLSPEQAAGGKVDPRADLYSLGVILHEMLTGYKPYLADDASALLHRHLHDPVPQLPVDLALFQPLLERLMAKQPDERFPTSRDALQAIRALMC